MLDWLGEPDAARLLRTAVERALGSGSLTPDVGGSLTTNDMTRAIVQHLG
jgi:tartrate dehydrogenase/decarboxylase/D-malate dehydrogenase